MKYKKYELNNYNLYTIYTDRFKTINFKVNIRVKYEKECDKFFPMLWRMLTRTSSKYSSIKDINRACAKVYDPFFSINSIESGKEIILSLSGSFINEKYTESGMNEKSIKFLLPFLFKPRIINNEFESEIFNLEKEKLINRYKSIKDYPRDYTGAMIEYYMNSRGFQEYSIEEIIEETKKLTSKELYNFYLKVLNEGLLDIFVCGNIDFDKMKNIFEKNILFNGKRKEKTNHIINQKNYNEDIKKYIEKSNNLQSNLALGCKIIDMTDFERDYVLTVYSWILGGGMNSLLHQTVREKNSLCYYIYTVKDKLRGILKIFSGINYKDFDKVLKLIKKEMDNIEKGKFSLELLENVKKIYLNSLTSIEDYQEDLIGNFISEIYLKDDNLSLKRKKISQVTKESLMEFAKKVHIDTVYLLKGDENE